MESMPTFFILKTEQYVQLFLRNSFLLEKLRESYYNFVKRLLFIEGGNNMQLFLLYGGRSAEHNVSISSAKAFLSAVDFNKFSVTLVYITKDGEWMKSPTLYSCPFDYEKEYQLNLSLNSDGETVSPMILKEENSVVFPLLHGPNGEDGTIQGLLEILDVPYAGPGLVACANGMDKILSKQLFLQAGIPQVSFLPVLLEDWRNNPDEIISVCKQQFQYPIYIKPANLGSSIGISEAHFKEELVEGIKLAFEYDRRIVIEQGVQAKEVKMGVLGNESIDTSTTCEIIKESNFFSYEDKYLKSGKKESFPALLTPEQETLINDYAVRAFKAIDGNGMARCDFFVTDEGEIFLNELNMIPGFSANSFVKLWKESGVSFTELIDRLIELGIERYHSKKTQTKLEL